MDFSTISFSAFVLAHLSAWVSALALLLALAVDRWWGEPRGRWHPVVWMGNYLGWTGRHLQCLARQGTQFTSRGAADATPDFKVFWLGALAWSVGAAIVYVASWTLQKGLLALPDGLGPIPGGMLAVLLLGLGLKPMLSWAMLRSEVLAVENALAPAQGGSLAAGRKRLAWLVSRDVTHLTEAQVRESAIETLAENLNDSVVAPIFWFVLLGLPGAALYRFANTADAMWGYHGVYQGRNWEWAGKWAAGADDVLSWLPARLTALFLALAVAGLPFKTLGREARKTPSPNSGWPMAAMALALGVALRKPGVYALNPLGRSPGAADTLRAQKYASKALVAHVLWMQAAILLIEIARGS